jgi:hypothetical protein
MMDPGGKGYCGVQNVPDLLAVTNHRIFLLDPALRHGQNSSFKPGEKFIYNGLAALARRLLNP